jgi:hypothetical protein
MTFTEWFWARVDRSGDCWEWQGSRTPAGYGKVIRQSPGDPSTVLSGRAHRLSYLMAYGPPPPDLFVLHTCDNPPCVNPAHLFLGTAEDNARDMSRKGRSSSQLKTHCPHGHPYDEANTYVTPRTGHRQCRTCREGWRAARPRKRAA